MAMEPKRRAVLIGAGILVILAIVVTVIVQHRRAGGLTLYGNVDIREVTLGFRVAGRIASLDVDEGDVVHAGQQLARLDPTPIELELAEARANATSLDRRMTLLRSGYRSEDVAQARASADERAAELANAEKALTREERLRGTGAVAERAYDDALAARDEARARLEAARQLYEAQRSGYRHQEVAEAEANHARADAAVAEADQHLKDTVLTAPADGVVLTRAVEPGAILAVGTPVFTISLRAPVWVRAYVGEPDLGTVPPGRKVLLYTDSRPGSPYHGQVGYVSPDAEFTPKNVETTDLRTALVYRLRVVVADPDEQLRQGMPVTVRLAPP